MCIILGPKGELNAPCLFAWACPGGPCLPGKKQFIYNNVLLWKTNINLVIHTKSKFYFVPVHENLIIFDMCIIVGPKGELNAPCLFAWACSDLNSFCHDGTCKCRRQFYEKNDVCGKRSFSL